MKFPQTPEDIKQEIYLSIDKYDNALNQRYRQFKKILQQVDDKLVTEGLIRVFADKTRGERTYQEQTFAGKLLYELKPDTDLSLTDILERVLDNYNLSIEELPFYLADKFGLTYVNDKLEQIDGKSSNPQIRESIRVFKYRLKIK
jgi:isocitrate dehydrogenase kinase/phosphatase